MSSPKKEFDVKVQHDDGTITALARMRQDLFGGRSQTIRMIVGIALIIVAVITGGNSWLVILFLAYGCYLLTGRYASADRSARILLDNMKKENVPFPASRYIFGQDGMRIITLPDGEELDPLPYTKVLQLGEDMKAYYLFRDQYGGYMIPKTELGEQEESFRNFVQSKTGKKFIRRLTPIRRLRTWLDSRNNEPEHL